MRNRMITSFLLGFMTLLVLPVREVAGATALQYDARRDAKIETSYPTRALAAKDDESTIEGSWTITEAKTPNDDEYGGTLDISAAAGEAENLYELSWETSAGSYSGLGFLEGDRLLVGYGLTQQIYGVALYRINGDGTLDGKWTFSRGNGEVGTEKATGGNSNRVEGEYRVGGSDPGSTDPEDPDSSYNGSLTIRRVRDTYQVSWKVDNQIYLGVGLRTGDWLVVGWGPGDGFAVMDYRIDDNKANGRWAISGDADLGVEKLTRHGL